MSDLIDRDEVIEIIESVCSADDTYWKPGTLEKIRNLSTHETPSNTLGALDCVERQAAIDLVESFYKIDKSVLKIMVFKLKQLPSAQPRKGKWIEHDDNWANVYYECSVCKEPFVLIDGTPAENLYNFCPNCGCRMKEGGSE